MHWFEDLTEARAKLQGWQQEYNEERLTGLSRTSRPCSTRRNGTHSGQKSLIPWTKNWGPFTATRSQEARGMQWSEVAMDKTVWKIPGSRTKTGKGFRVPLSSRALEILKEQKAVVGESPLVFPAPRGSVMSDATMSKMVRQANIDGVPHAIARACFRFWAADVKRVTRNCRSLSRPCGQRS